MGMFDYSVDSTKVAQDIYKRVCNKEIPITNQLKPVNNKQDCWYGSIDNGIFTVILLYSHSSESSAYGYVTKVTYKDSYWKSVKLFENNHPAAQNYINKYTGYNRLQSISLKSILNSCDGSIMGSDNEYYAYTDILKNNIGSVDIDTDLNFYVGFELLIDDKMYRTTQEQLNKYRVDLDVGYNCRDKHLCLNTKVEANLGDVVRMLLKNKCYKVHNDTYNSRDTLSMYAPVQAFTFENEDKGAFLSIGKKPKYIPVMRMLAREMNSVGLFANIYAGKQTLVSRTKLITSTMQTITTQKSNINPAITVTHVLTFVNKTFSDYT